MKNTRIENIRDIAEWITSLTRSQSELRDVVSACNLQYVTDAQLNTIASNLTNARHYVASAMDVIRLVQDNASDEMRPAIAINTKH